MRKLIVHNFVSLDGYFEGEGRNVMALPFDHAFSEYNAERLRTADTFLLGRTTFEGFQSYWPPVAGDESAPELEREISRLNGAIQKVVVSDSLTPDELGAWQNTEIVKRGDAHDRIAELKRQPGGDILVFGSHTLWNDLLAAGLVDEVHLMIGAGAIGAGTPAFEGQPPVSLRLLDTRTWEGQGVVLVRYAVQPK
ncbi:MAG: dihydrofolate reductase family protein [Micromonosporaceae bacterium]